jgi:catechol 2,3-dioxygenase-like lactoylglutathione lyase family enzyme
MLEYKQAFSGVSVDDIPGAKEFYGETLGLKVTEDEAGFLQLHIGDGDFVFVYPKPDHEPATYTMLNFVVDDIDRAVEQLTDAGVSFEDYEDTDDRGVMRGRSIGRGPDIAWFRDRAGNVLAVMQV